MAVVYLVISVGVSLLRRHHVRQSRPPIGARPSPAEILACHDEVEHLFWDLNARYAEVPERLGKGLMSVRSRGREIQSAWRHRWREVGQHCRFNELRGTGLGAGFDQLAAVHAHLEELEIGYASLLSRFGRQLAPEVDKIRRRLEVSKRAIEQHARQAGAPPAQN